MHDALVKLKGEKDAAGSRVDFYSILEVSPASSQSEINRAYRKNSLALHPDKNPDPEAAALYALLTSINAILKNNESRERYDRHRAKGIPRWRGTGYFIAKYKPGLTFVITFVIGAISFAQYLTSWILFTVKKRSLESERAAFHQRVHSPNDLTYTDIRKMIKRATNADPPATIKKAIKAGRPAAEILLMPEMAQVVALLPPNQQLDETDDPVIAKLIHQVEASRPSLTATLIVQLPVGLFKLIFQVLPAAAWGLVEGGDKGKKKSKSKKKTDDELFYAGEKGGDAPWDKRKAKAAGVISSGEESSDGDEDDEELFVDDGEGGRVEGINSSLKAERSSAFSDGSYNNNNSSHKRGVLSAKFINQRKKQHLRQSSEDGGDGGDTASPPPTRKCKVRPSTGGMTKAEFIKQAQARMKK